MAMELHNGTVYVTPCELRKLGVDANTVKVGVKRARKGAPGWKVETVGQPGAELIRYDTIPTRTAQAANLPTPAVLIAQLQQQQATYTAHQTALQADALAHELTAYVEATYQQYENALLPLVRRLPAVAQAHARLQAAFEWCMGPGAAHPQATQLAAFLTLEGLPFRPQPTRTGEANPETARASFARKLARYRAATDKPAALVNKHTVQGNANARKVTAEGVAFLVKLQRQNQPKLRPDELLTRYNTAAPAQGWGELRSVQTVRNVLRETRPQWEAARDGKKIAQQRTAYTFKRRPAPHPDARIEIDGTVAPIYYRNSLGKLGYNLYGVYVVDCHSGAIVGSAYAEGSESNDLITRALRDYLERWHRRPHQANYDGGIAGKPRKDGTRTPMQALLDRMTHLHFKTQQNRPQARRIEGIIGALQETEIRDLPYFRGSNITSQRDRTRKANEDWAATLDTVAGRATLPSIDEAIAALRECERRYNEQLDTKRGQRRIDLYTAAYAECEPITTAQIVSLFMTPRPYPVMWTAKGLQIQVAGERLDYEVREGDDETADPDMHFHGPAATRGDRFRVYDDPHNREVVWIGPVKEDTAPTRPAFRKYEFPEVHTDAQPGELERLRRIQTKSKQYLADAYQGADAPTDEAAPTPAPLGVAELGTAQGKAAWNAANNLEELRAHGLLHTDSPFALPDEEPEMLD